MVYDLPAYAGITESEIRASPKFVSPARWPFTCTAKGLLWDSIGVRYHTARINISSVDLLIARRTEPLTSLGCVLLPPLT